LNHLIQFEKILVYARRCRVIAFMLQTIIGIIISFRSHLVSVEY